MTPEEMVARAALSRRADAGDRQAGRAPGASRPEGRREPGGPFRRAALRPAAAARRWRIGSTATPPAAWCSAATARRWRSWASCSSTARSARPIGRWSRAARRRTKAASTCRSASSTPDRGWWMKPDPEGQPCVDDLDGDGRAASGLTWLALEPVTGRTHQLRVHCAAMGWPILGDNIYGNAPRDRRRRPCICMRARSWCRSTRTSEPVRVTAPVPPHMRAAADGVRMDGGDQTRVRRVSTRGLDALRRGPVVRRAPACPAVSASICRLSAGSASTLVQASHSVRAHRSALEHWQ